MRIIKHSWSQTHPHADHQALLVTNTSTCGSPSTPGHKHIHMWITKHSWSQTHPHADHQALLVTMWITKHSWSQTHPHVDHQALLVTNASTCGSPSTPGHKRIHTRITKHSWSQTHPHADHQALLVSNTSTCRSTSTTSHKHIHMWIILEQLHITKQPSVCCFLVSVENVAHTRLQRVRFRS